MRETVRRVFYALFRRTTPLEIAGHRLNFWSAEPRMFDRICNAGGEREQMERFVRDLRPGDVVWDIGAFIGMYSLFSSQAVGADGTVYAFEPEPATASRAQYNYDLNGKGNIKLLNCALGAEDGKATIYPSKANQNAIHSLRPNQNVEQSGIDITIRSGDDLVAKGEIKAPTAIKMDIEGAEFQALSGMRTILNNKNCRLIFLELHPQDLPTFGATADQVMELIQGAGFRLDHETRRGSEYHQFYVKSA